MYHFSLCANAVPDLIILYYVLFEQLMLDPLRIKHYTYPGNFPSFDHALPEQDRHKRTMQNWISLKNECHMALNGKIEIRIPADMSMQTSSAHYRPCIVNVRC
jgi:hypothetical protein